MRADSLAARWPRGTQGSPCLVMVHGWGLAPTMWTPLIEALRGVETITVDLGFFGAPAIPALPADRSLVGVGHSLGFAWLLRRPIQWRGLVSVNGFSRFLRGDDFPKGVAPRIVSRMQSKLKRDARAVVEDFLRRCGDESVTSYGAQERALAEALDWLVRWDVRSALREHDGALLALADRADPIVPEVMSRSCFPTSTLRWRDIGGHLLPSSDPGWCAAQLSAFLRGLE